MAECPKKILKLAHCVPKLLGARPGCLLTKEVLSASSFFLSNMSSKMYS